jgi:hypothetical protein
LAVVYRGIAAGANHRDLYQLPVKPVCLGMALEILCELNLIFIEGERIVPVSNPVKREFTESAILKDWQSHLAKIESWVKTVTHSSAADLVKSWIG